jgi:hypothetical protein
MTLRVVGAGLGRTGTMSLKVALERLLGGRCHHMMEVFAHPEQVGWFHAAARGEMPDWRKVFDGYQAGVDWPMCAYWPEISAAFPDALILHSVRDTDSWWKSASETIFKGMKLGAERMPDWHAMVKAVMEDRFIWPPDREAEAKAAYERWNADVRARAPKGRVLEWRASDGWEPICKALGLPVPAEPFPRVNTREDFVARMSAAP